MDNKFLEEAGVILRKLSANVAFSDPKKRPISQEEIIAEHLSTLSSKHKDDVRALREAVVAATKCPESENNPTHRCSALHCNYCGLCPANEDEATGIPKIIDAFDSTLKDLGIEL